MNRKSRGREKELEEGREGKLLSGCKINEKNLMIITIMIINTNNENQNLNFT